jgi:hypothetical protein
MAASRFVALSLIAFSIAGCGSDSSGGKTSDGGAGGTPSNGSSICEAACPGILQAKCSGGPPSQAECVTGCDTVRTGACASLFQRFMDCGGATPKYSCNTNGNVSIVGCDSESTALWTCVMGPS